MKMWENSRKSPTTQIHNGNYVCCSVLNLLSLMLWNFFQFEKGGGWKISGNGQNGALHFYGLYIFIL